MDNLKGKWIYIVLLVPVISSILALLHFGFFFKSGSAGTGILILLFLYFKKRPRKHDQLMIMAAFLFSIVGDWFLSNKQDDAGMFVAGIVFFFFAHLGYLWFAVMNGKINLSITLLFFGIYIVFFGKILFPCLDDPVLMWPVLIYLIISCLSLGAAVGIRANPLAKLSYVFGIFLILFSDTIIAYKEFLDYRNLNWLILPTYYLAHISIVFSLINRYLFEAEGTTTH
ncbi:MAG: lysoplasmalogenase [Mariniphaga sp.]|nr:lysoplasmalogenase [Mariniphaga sp.]